MGQCKLRAETIADIHLFVAAAYKDITSFEPVIEMPGIPDVEFEFTSILTLDEIIDVLKLIEDGHVMYQTVQPVKKYTGERNYEII